MNPNQIRGLLALCLLPVANSPAAVRYVDVNSANPTPPYTTWSTAATNIQDAVDLAVANDQILVTNGVYQTGGRAVFGTVSNRVAVEKALMMRSVNGPEVTIIRGDAAIRCVYLESGASLSGFTLTSGGTSDVGDVAREQSGGGVWCESITAVVSNCVVAGNSAAYYGGGVYQGTLNNCTLWSNSVPHISPVPFGHNRGGGGVYQGTLNNCILSGNSGTFGGGATSCTLNNCVLTGNVAFLGGGASESTLNNCTLTANSALGDFGYNGRGGGGGTSGSTLFNCTLTGNSAPNLFGGGASDSFLNNCIVYYNTAPADPNYRNGFAPGTLNYCCTTPLPANGVGNITNAPLFIDQAGGNFHLQPNSPCIDAGTNLTGVITNDLDGRPRPLDGNADGVAAFDIGAYEHLVLFVRQDNSSPAPPYNSWSAAVTNIQDAVDTALTGAGDQILVTNGVYQSGGRTGFGRVAVDRPVSIQSVNGPQSTLIDGGGTVRCVYLTNGTFLSGFTLTNGVALDSGGGVGFVGAPGLESDAVVSNCVIVGNSASSGGGAGSVAYTGGNLPVGGTLSDCILSGNSATAFQPGNPTVGIGGAVDNCKLNKCTLLGNSAAYGGGGASASTLHNCIVTGNSAMAEGGGARSSTLDNCLLNANSTGGGGGGAASSTLVNCTLTDNSALSVAGGAYFSYLRNCILYYNNAPNAPNHFANNFWFDYCCTIPLPGNGVGNFTNAPLFIDQATGNLRLQSNSPCINSGLNTYASAGLDVDGNPRLAGGTVDVGAYEFQSPASTISYAWLQQYGFPTDGSADYADSDTDRMDNWQEWIAGTVPTNDSSVLRLLNLSHDASGVTVTWQSVSNRTYFLERAADLGAAPPFSLLSSNIAGQAVTTSYTDTNAFGPFFYRVGIQP